MPVEFLPLERCAEIAGLLPQELLLGVAPDSKHHGLWESYRLNLHKGQDAVRAMIVADLRSALDLGAALHAASLLLVLRRLLAAAEQDSPPWDRPGKTKRNASDAPRRPHKAKIQWRAPEVGALAPDNVYSLEQFRRTQRTMARPL
jgi:hypothetical protein